VRIVASIALLFMAAFWRLFFSARPPLTLGQQLLQVRNLSKVLDEDCGRVAERLGLA
jgi:hypothetical protein